MVIVFDCDFLFQPNTLVFKYCDAHSLPFSQWPYQLPANQYDLGIVVSFGAMIDAASINSCKHGMINMHPSLLPRWRGSSPIQRTVFAGDRESGITILTIKPDKFDIGDILIQEKYSLPDKVKSKDLYGSFAQKGAHLLIMCLKDLHHYLSNAKPQSNEGACYAKKLKKTDSFVDWTKLTSSDVDRMFRAYDGFVNLHCKWFNDKELKLHKMADHDLVSSLDWSKAELAWHGKVLPVPGLCIYNPSLKCVSFKCKDHNWVAFSRLSFQSQSAWSAQIFYSRIIKKLPKPIVLPGLE